MNGSIDNYKRPLESLSGNTNIAIYLFDSPCIFAYYAPCTWHVDWPQGTLEFKSSMHELVDSCKTCVIPYVQYA